MPNTAQGFIIYYYYKIAVRVDTEIHFVPHFMYTFSDCIYVLFVCITQNRSFYDWIYDMQFYYNFMEMEVIE